MPNQAYFRSTSFLMMLYTALGAIGWALYTANGR
jgi:hypothetical protein